jgi:hypothetical protein
MTQILDANTSPIQLTSIYKSRTLEARAPFSLATRTDPGNRITRLRDIALDWVVDLGIDIVYMTPDAGKYPTRPQCPRLAVSRAEGGVPHAGGRSSLSLMATSITAVCVSTPGFTNAAWLDSLNCDSRLITTCHEFHIVSAARPS